MTCDHPPFGLKSIERDRDRHVEGDVIPLQGWCESCTAPVKVSAKVETVERADE